MGRIRVLAFVAVSSANLFVGCATVDQKFGDQEWYQKSKEVSAKAVNRDGDIAVDPRTVLPKPKVAAALEEERRAPPSPET
jgi:hypothetical protein